MNWDEVCTWEELMSDEEAERFNEEVAAEDEG